MSIDLFIDPFADFAFMRRALAACVILSVGGTPLGVFMTLRRMTLMGDALSHALLPGIAVAFAIAGLSIVPLAIGGLAAGVLVALAALFLTRFTFLKEDASFTIFYLLSLAAGVALISLNGSNVDLFHLLFGNILAVDNAALLLMAGVGCVTLLTLAGFYRSLVIDSFDPSFAQSPQRRRLPVAAIFFLLLVINLVAAFQALGTLMALGLMILPALAARFWTKDIDAVLPLSMLFALAASVAGLLISYYSKIPTGPAIVLTAGGFALLSALIGAVGSIAAYMKEGG